MELRYILKNLLLPPFGHIVLLLLAWRLRRQAPRLARAGFLLAVFSLWLLGTPVVATWLALSLERDPALQPDHLLAVQADAIVILAGSQSDTAPEFGEPISRPEQLARIRYGAFLHRRTGLPVLVSGGSVKGTEQRSLAETMAYDLVEGFGIKPRWLESRSRTTAENSLYSYRILAGENKTSIVLVTSALHMMRARWSYEQAGFRVVPAPTNSIDRRPLTLGSFLPNAHSLSLSSRALHEWFGYWVYRALAGG